MSTSRVRSAQRGAAVLLAGTALAAGLSACSSNSGSTATHPGTSSSVSSGSVNFAGAATRWWSDSAGTSGSTIDISNPTSAASAVHPSQSVYCGILTATANATKSQLTAMQTKNAASVATLRAFVAELEASAPTEVSSAWRTLGGALLALVDSKAGHASTGTASSAQISAASQAIVANAEQKCGLTAQQLTGSLGSGSSSK